MSVEETEVCDLLPPHENGYKCALATAICDIPRGGELLQLYGSTYDVLLASSSSSRNKCETSFRESASGGAEEVLVPSDTDDDTRREGATVFGEREGFFAVAERPA